MNGRKGKAEPHEAWTRNASGNLVFVPSFPHGPVRECAVLLIIIHDYFYYCYFFLRVYPRIGDHREVKLCVIFTFLLFFLPSLLFLLSFLMVSALVVVALFYTCSPTGQLVKNSLHNPVEQCPAQRTRNVQGSSAA